MANLFTDLLLLTAAPGLRLKFVPIINNEVDISNHPSLSKLRIEFTSVRGENKVLSRNPERITRPDHVSVQIHDRGFQFDLCIRFHGLLIIGLDYCPVHLDILIIETLCRLHIELHFHFSLVIPNRNTQPLDLMSNRHRQLNPSSLLWFFRRSKGSRNPNDQRRGKVPLSE